MGNLDTPNKHAHLSRSAEQVKKERGDTRRELLLTAIIMPMNDVYAQLSRSAQLIKFIQYDRNKRLLVSGYGCANVRPVREEGAEYA